MHTRSQTRAHSSEPPRLRRWSAIRRITLTREGRRRARELLIDPDATIFYHFSRDDAEGLVHYLEYDREVRCFREHEDMPRFTFAEPRWP